MKKFFYIFIILISIPTWAEEFKCPPDTLLIDFTPSSTQERIQVCQKKIDGKFVKHGPEIIYNKDGTVKSKNYYQRDVLTTPPQVEDKLLFEQDHKSHNLTKDMVIATDFTTCALINGGVKCWGTNNLGLVGDGTTVDKNAPTEVSGLTSGVQTIATGGTHSCALINGGVKCWGNNFFVMGATRYLAPHAMEFSAEVKSISAGGNSLCALMLSGGVKCLGENFSGALGDGTNKNKNSPTQVIGLTSGVSAIASGFDHSCALMTDGGVKCWGQNNMGQLGDGTTANKNTPTQVIGLTSGVGAIVAGHAHTCALMIDGGVKCWGGNGAGVLGDGTTVNKNTPTQVIGLSSSVQALATGNAETCALTSNGGIECWGIIGDKQLGVGRSEQIIKLSPVPISGLTSGAKAIAVGLGHACALMINGGAKCWGGTNQFGQLGDGSNITKSFPTQVIGL